jgi:8-hydroxy-5-deazaflavin:NADPH oxidoreductase
LKGKAENFYFGSTNMEFTMKIGILGSGDVAKTLAAGFLKHGHQVMLGTRDAAKLVEWKNKNAAASVGSFDQAAAFGELLVLAVKGSHAHDALKLVAATALAGKTVIDATNPIGDTPPTNGVINYFTGANDSLMEQLQRAFPAAHFVKAFNSVGNPFMVNPQFAGGPPTMFICGNNDAAKAQVTQILTQFGWESEDMGKVESAQPIEALCILWCARGFNRGQWTHAFKLLK